MKIVIKSQGTMAIYEQIVNQLKNGIVSGELKPGEAMPSIRRLASDLEVSVITTKRAYEELEKEGLLRSVSGKGFYVCEANQDYLKEKQLITLERHMKDILEECLPGKDCFRVRWLPDARGLYSTGYLRFVPGIL